MAKIIKSVRWLLMLIIAMSVTMLTAFAFGTGQYVGVLQDRTEAQDAGAGGWDILGDGKWHWFSNNN